MKKVLGFIMLLSLFVGMNYYFIMSGGLKETLIAYGIVVVIVGFLFGGMKLISD